MLAAVVACEEPKEIGLAPTNEVGVLYTDTLTITRTTAQFDSVRSNDQSTLLVGRYTDPTFGQVQAKSYVALQQSAAFVVNDSNTTNPTPASRIILDSTRLIVSLSGVWYGDTSVPHEIVVTRMADSLRRSQNYDISSVVPVSNQIIARRTILPRPLSADTSTIIPIDNSIGRELLALANSNASTLNSSGTFVDPNGFRQQITRDFQFSLGGSSSASVLGFSPSNTGILVYYHVEGEKTAFRGPKYFPFSGKRFNQLTASRANTPLSTLRPGQSLTTTVTGRTYAQPGTGITTKLAFPSLKALLQSGRLAINRADLIVTPLAAEDAKRPLPRYLALAEIDGNNRLIRSDLSTGAVRLFTVQTQGPISRSPVYYTAAQVQPLDPRTNSYTFQVAGYLQSIVSGVSPNNGLAILTPSVNGLFGQSPTTGALIDQTQAVLSDRVWRMVLDGKASVKLVLFYTKSN